MAAPIIPRHIQLRKPSSHVRDPLIKNKMVAIRNALLIVCLFSILTQFYLYNLAYAIKALLSFLVCYYVARETEILFYTHIRSQSRKEALEKVKTTYPGIVGLIFALIIPTAFPLWAMAIGVIGAIIIGRLIFGGFGFNIFNESLIGKIIVAISWPVFLTSIMSRDYSGNWLLIDFFSHKEINNIVKINLLEILNLGNIPNISILDMLFGFHTGALGEISPLVLIGVAIYLVYKKAINLFSLLITTFWLFLLFLIVVLVLNLEFEYILYQLLSGSIVFALIFIVADNFTSPMSKEGQIYYGFIIALLIVVIRLLGYDLDGVVYAVLFANMLTPMLNSATFKTNKNITYFIITFIVIMLILVLLALIYYRIFDILGSSDVL